MLLLHFLSLGATALLFKITIASPPGSPGPPPNHPVASNYPPQDHYGPLPPLPNANDMPTPPSYPQGHYVYPPPPRPPPNHPVAAPQDHYPQYNPPSSNYWNPGGQPRYPAAQGHYNPQDPGPSSNRNPGVQPRYPAAQGHYNPQYPAPPPPNHPVAAPQDHYPQDPGPSSNRNPGVQPRYPPAQGHYNGPRRPAPIPPPPSAPNPVVQPSPEGQAVGRRRSVRMPGPAPNQRPPPAPNPVVQPSPEGRPVVGNIITRQPDDGKSYIVTKRETGRTGLTRIIGIPIVHGPADPGVKVDYVDHSGRMGTLSLASRRAFPESDVRLTDATVHQEALDRMESARSLSAKHKEAAKVAQKVAARFRDSPLVESSQRLAEMHENYSQYHTTRSMNVHNPNPAELQIVQQVIENGGQLHGHLSSIAYYRGVAAQAKKPEAALQQVAHAHAQVPVHVQSAQDLHEQLTALQPVQQ